MATASQPSAGDAGLIVTTSPISPGRTTAAARYLFAQGEPNVFTIPIAKRLTPGRTTSMSPSEKSRDACTDNDARYEFTPPLATMSGTAHSAAPAVKATATIA